jgi:hypothetical protein
MKHRLVSLLLGLLLLQPATAETLKLEGLQERVEQLIWWGDFDAVERLLQLAEADRRTDANGDTALMHLNRGLGYPGSRADKHPAYLKEWLRLAQDWAKRRPDSPLAHRLVAEAHTDHAWYERGSGYAKSVGEEGFKAFRAHIEAARAHLLAHPAMLEQSSQIYHPLLTIGMASGWTPKLMLSLVREGLKRNPRDFSLFFKAQLALTPKWSGDARAIEDLIQLAVQHTEAEFGLEYYARLYAGAADDYFEQELFTGSYAKWPRMKQGFQQMVARQSGDRALNRYAMYACLAKDRAAYTEAIGLLTQRQQELRAIHWSALGGQRMLDGCRRWGDSS